MKLLVLLDPGLLHLGEILLWRQKRHVQTLNKILLPSVANTKSEMTSFKLGERYDMCNWQKEADKNICEREDGTSSLEGVINRHSQANVMMTYLHAGKGMD